LIQGLSCAMIPPTRDYEKDGAHMPTKTYTAEDKLNALRLCDEIGVQKASEETGITLNSLYAWRRSRSELMPTATDPVEFQAGSEKRIGEGSKAVRNFEPTTDELIHLRVENEMLKAQITTLKNALRAFTE